eukprot:m51a1_g5507 hypothetical protein (610) ;mRNA; r:375933-377875
MALQAAIYAPIAAAVSAHVGGAFSPEEITSMLQQPNVRGVAADIALPCFKLAQKRRVPPPALAEELAASLSAAGFKAVASGPFLNLTVAPADVAKAVGVAEMEASQQATVERAMRSSAGAGRTMCIDFSSPNIAKHLAFHHIRSTMIGNAIANMYKAVGWRTVRINFLGDWGTAFGRLISGWKRENLTMEQLNAAPDKVTFLNELYVRASVAAKDNAELEEDARRWSKALEDGDQEARHLWQVFKDASLAEFERVYKMLGVTFDSWKGESCFEGAPMEEAVKDLEAKGLLSVDNGATIVDLPKIMGKKAFKTPALIKRADGGSLYTTRDIAACDDRYREYHFDRSVYVVDLGQSLHFQELFAIVKMLGRPYAQDVGTPKCSLRHVAFGVMLLWDDESKSWGKGRTRSGGVMLLREVLEEAVERAAAVIAEKNPEIPPEERQRIAGWVGVGAVVFNDLKNNRAGDVKFKLEDALRFDGETGPYLQFAHARLCSIERKFAESQHAATLSSAPDMSAIKSDLEKQVLLAISRMQPALERGVEADDPSALATVLLQLAAVVSTWLSAGSSDAELRVLHPDPVVARARLAIVRIARYTLGEGLRLLGLVPPERM